MADPRDDAAALAAIFLDHPLAARFAQKINATGDNTVHSAADVLGERLIRLAGLLVLVADDPARLAMNVRPDDKVQAAVGFARLAAVASPYLWTEEVRAAVRGTTTDEADARAKLPRHVISPKLLPEPSMWWTFETGINIGPAVLDANFVTDDGDRFRIFSLGALTDGMPFIEVADFAYGSVFPDDHNDVAGRNRLTATLMFLAFLNSPYIPKAQQRLTRYERREIERRHAVDIGETVTWINLRRPEARPTVSGGTGAERKHRWVVSGHYRAQWYPSEQAHHVIWIAPYMKGPDDAPMIEHAYKVVR